MRDLVVVGGGPVGLATALHAARAGLDVEVRERRSGVLDKACGEGLMPGAVAALSTLGVPLEGHPILGIRYLDDVREAEAPFRRGQGLGVRRTTLHAALQDAARNAGITVVQRPVRTVTNHGDHVQVDAERTRHVVAADGLHSPVRRTLGLAAEPVPVRRYGQRAHVTTAPWSDYVEVHWSPWAEAYVTPVAPDRVGIAVLSGHRRPLTEQLGWFPRLSRRLEGRPLSRVLGAGPLRQRTRGRVAGRVLLVGDAAGYVDALTGEGLAVGMAQARAAVDAVVADDPDRYEAEWQRICRRHDRLTAGLLAATSIPLVRRHVVAAAARMPWLFRTAVDQLARPT